MKPLACRLRLHGYLTFSSFVGVSTTGKVAFTEYKPAPVIHNYPLMYALAGLSHGSLASLAWERPLDAVHQSPPPKYTLIPSIEKKLYAYPAKPFSIVTARMLSVAGGERLVHLQVRPKSMYPWRVIHRYFAPGTIFDTLVILNEEARIPRTIRLGAKRYGVFSVECKIAREEGEWNGFSDPVNLDDVRKWGYNVLKSLTILERKKGGGTIARAIFDKPVKVLKARFRDGLAEFKLPLPRGN